jgi:Cu2+-exporting ATPase
LPYRLSAIQCDIVKLILKYARSQQYFCRFSDLRLIKLTELSFMGLLRVLAVVNGALLPFRSASPPPPKSLPLIEALIDGEVKEAVLLPPALPGPLNRVQSVVSELLSDTRQTQQHALNPVAAAQPVDNTAQMQKQNLLVAATGWGLGILGGLGAPLLYVPSALCTLYAFRFLFTDAYRIYAEERRLDYRAIWAMIIPAALAIGAVTSAAFGALLGIVGYYLVAKTENRSKQQIAELFGGQIGTVWLLVDGVEVEASLAQLNSGDIIVVQAGQMIPVDGTIVTGTATVDQHMLTGEAQPVEKAPGDGVLTATIVLSGRIQIQVEKAGEATVAAQITQVLNQSSNLKRALQSRTDRMMNRLTWPILGLSALAVPFAGLSGAVAVLWYYPGGRLMNFGALSMLSTLQVAAQRGILVKDGRALETLTEIDTVVFDKTGTLTLEQPTVSQVFCYNGLVQQDLLRYAAAAEAKQSHPIARAILQAAADHSLTLPPLEEAHYKVGYGLKTRIEGVMVCVGSVRFMQMEGIAVPLTIIEQQAASHAIGNSLVLVALNNEIVGALELTPTIRPEADAIIRSLHARGIQTVIISGDNEAPTQRLATELGISRYFAEVLPQDKANLVAQLQAEGHKVCFVGDGINDAIALKTANVAISLRGATTIATDMADIVFMDGALRQLPTLFQLADEFAANMFINLVAAVVPPVLGIASTLFLGWGFGIAVVLSQVNLPVGIYNALRPLLDEEKNRQKLLPVDTTNRSVT